MLETHSHLKCNRCKQSMLLIFYQNLTDLNMLVFGKILTNLISLTFMWFLILYKTVCQCVNGFNLTPSVWKLFFTHSNHKILKTFRLELHDQTCPLSKLQLLKSRRSKFKSNEAKWVI